MEQKVPILLEVGGRMVNMRNKAIMSGATSVVVGAIE